MTLLEKTQVDSNVDLFCLWQEIGFRITVITIAIKEKE